MRDRLLILVAGIVSLADPSAAARAEEPKNQLLGTWKLVSAKYGGKDYKFPDGSTTVKHVTPTQFMWATYDADGSVTRTAGGTYTLKGDAYEETSLYGVNAGLGLKKDNVHTFRWKIDGNKWHHTGKLAAGLTIEEVWERDEKK
jgi:hypothetical protein